MEKPVYPMRINKYMALKNYSTRRGADDLIAKKQVFINGKLAVLGSKVNEHDIVEVRGGRGIAKKYLYFAYNKPRGIITHSPGRGETDIKRATSLKGVFPVGRLDKDSHGLMILTNDGRITDKLLNPEYYHEKEYVVTVKNKLRSSFKQYMEQGINLGDYTTKPCEVHIIDDTAFAIILTEGKKHQIRRMVLAMHNEVTDLMRIRVMNIELEDLPEGGHRQIQGEELSIFLKSLGIQ